MLIVDRSDNTVDFVLRVAADPIQPDIVVSHIIDIDDPRRMFDQFERLYQPFGIIVKDEIYMSQMNHLN